MLMLELRNCLHRKEIKFVFSFLMLISIGGFLLECSRFYGMGMTNIRSAYEMSLIQGTSVHVLLSVECILIPLIASIIYSDSFYVDYQSGVYKSILTRTDTKTYIRAKGIVTFGVTFFVFLIPLLWNQVLCLITFPTEGFDNRFALPPYDIGTQNFNNKFMFDLLRVQSPLLYNLLYMFLISLVAALFAVFAYGAFLVFKKGRFATIAGVFSLYVVVEMAVTAWGSFRLSLINLLQSGNQGSLSVLLLWISILFVLGIVMIAGQSYRFEAK
jgi:hypothetical protein